MVANGILYTIQDIANQIWYLVLKIIFYLLISKIGRCNPTASQKTKRLPRAQNATIAPTP